MKRLKKNNKKEKDPNKASFIEVFEYLYKTYPGMKSLIILLLYGLLFTMLILVVATNTSDNSNDESTNNTTTTTVTSITYKEMLDNLVNINSSIKYNIVIDEVTYYIDVIYENNILSGTYEDSLGSIYKFKISDDNIYEISMNNETLNNELLKNINIDYIIPSHLINILETNKSIKTKEDDNIIYTYDIDNISYIVYTKDNGIYKVEVKDLSSVYTLEFE